MTRIFFNIIWILQFTLLPVNLYPVNDNINNNDNNENNQSEGWHQSTDRQEQQQLIDENGTIIIAAASPHNSTIQCDPQNPMAQFNERRRDMFFEDYSVKQIQVIDTVAITNNSLNSAKTTTKNGINGGISGTQKHKNSAIYPILIETLNSNQINTKQEIDILPNLNNSSTVSINLPDNHHQNNDHNEENFLIRPQRPNVLLPKLEASSGRPTCLQTPDDTFCENVENYPKGIIKEEMDFSVDQFSEIFGNKEIDGRTIMDIENDESVCSKTPRVIFPKMAKNQANQWIYVVNEVEYTQAVVAEICERPGKPCAYMENLPLGMTSKCKQKYSYKRLLALHPTEKRTYPDAFRFPSCCACYIKLMDDFLARSNFRKIDKQVKVMDGHGKSSQQTSDDNSSELPSPLVSSSSSSPPSVVLISSSSIEEDQNNNNDNGGSPMTSTETSSSLLPKLRFSGETTFIPLMAINQSIVIDE